MATTNEHITIPKKVESLNDLDYSFLKQKGLSYIEELSSNFWTDYNIHDPGVTMLHMLCYAITDLSNRINLPIENILEPGKGETPVDKQFFIASDILPSKSVSETDYRKLFVDIEGIKNCWLSAFKKTVYVDYKGVEPGDEDKLSYSPFNPGGLEDDKFDLNGLYRLWVDLETGVGLPDVEDEIYRVYNANRNLCEDLVAIKEVGEHPIAVCAKIEVESGADEEKIYAEVELAIEKYFSPNIGFYSLKQMFEKGYKTDEIFDGPLLTNGFIDTKELNEANLRKEVRLSDIMQLIMEIEGVKVITDISISDCKTKDEKDTWLICVENGKKPVLYDKEVKAKEEVPRLCKVSQFSFYKGVLPLNINKSKVEEHRNEIIAKQEKLHAQAALGMELEIPKGIYSHIGETTTIQNDFPDTYGIGKVGVPAKATEQRKAMAKQLKAYLLFFDQVFASYFAHLEKVKEQLSVNNNFLTETKEIVKTYFTQAVNDLKNMEELVEDYAFDDDDLLSEKLFSVLPDEKELDDKVKRNNILLDHLIARFAEKFGEYSFLMKQLYGDYSEKAVIDAKQNFLQDYQVISGERGLAFNCKLKDEVWDTGNVSGFQKRISRFTGIKNYQRRNLSESYVEIYIEPGIKPDVVYRWRIRDKSNEIILSATDDYKTPRLAEEELQFAVVKVVETSLKEIEDAFNISVSEDDIIGNLLVRVSDGGLYSFDVINKDKPQASVDRIIARQFNYYETQEDLKQAMLELVNFMSGDFSEEGMFVVEHILLRPDFKLDDEVANTQFMPVCIKEDDNCQPIDPYSYRLTIILPGWTYRFANVEFRRFMEKLIRTELPAHILARICWVGYRSDYYKLMLETNRIQIEKQLNKLEEIYNSKLEEITDEPDRAELENRYLKLLEELNARQAENNDKYKDQLTDLTTFEDTYKEYLHNLSLDNLKNFEADPNDITDEIPIDQQRTPCRKLIDAMTALNTIYQQGKLFECSDETDELKGRIILDQTNLGTL